MKDREYLLHVQRAISEIAEHTAGLTREAYEADTKTQRASSETSRSSGRPCTGCRAG
jgi:uncharacterized protein with HEPN domain